MHGHSFLWERDLKSTEDHILSYSNLSDVPKCLLTAEECEQSRNLGSGLSAARV